jgi:hypothetical protein
MLEKFHEGDVVYTTCCDYALCHHVGIVYFDGVKRLIYHNDPSNSNRYGGTVVAEPYEKFIKGRVLNRIVTTNATNEDILRVAKKCRNEQWNSLFFNCEDFVLEIVEGKRRSELRDIWKLVALGTSTLLLL